MVVPTELLMKGKVGAAFYIPSSRYQYMSSLSPRRLLLGSISPSDIPILYAAKGMCSLP